MIRKTQAMERATESTTEENLVVRMKNVASRMVGMYRLLSEQLPTHTFSADVVLPRTKPERSSRREWERFRSIFMDILERNLLNERSMYNMLRRLRANRQGVGALIKPDKITYPEQAVNIHLGIIMEQALKQYISQRAEPLPIEVRRAFKKYVSKNVQWDLAFKKGDTVFIFETKYNLNLDTEKTEKVIEKLDTFSIFLKKYYKNENVKTVTGLVSLYYSKAADIPDRGLKPALIAVKDLYLIGYSDLFNLFGVKVTPKMWGAFHRRVVGPEIYRAYRRAINKYFRK